MQTSQLKQCTDCDSLLSLYNKVVCSIYQLIKNKWIGHTYNSDLYFDADLYGTLIRFKRVLYKRLFNQEYPSECFSNQDIITTVNKLLYKQNDCQKCPCEDFSEFITSSTTTTTLAPVEVCYSYTVVATDPGSVESIVDYIACGGAPMTTLVPESGIKVVCAREGEIEATNAIIIKGGSCS